MQLPGEATSSTEKYSNPVQVGFAGFSRKVYRKLVFLRLKQASRPDLSYNYQIFLMKPDRYTICQPYIRSNLR